MIQQKRRRAVRTGPYRSKMEERLVPELIAQGAEYEPFFLRYTERNPKRYTPDVVLPNGVVIEIKGWFPPADRSKMLNVKASYPALDIRMVLASPEQTLSKSSKTTQAQWCVSNGFPWAHNCVPLSWILAEPYPDSIQIIKKFGVRKAK